MANAQEILVIILSSFLAIFLVLNIILLVVAIKIAKSVKRITEHAESVVQKAEAFSDFISYASTPMNIARMVADAYGRIFKSKSDKKGRMWK